MLHTYDDNDIQHRVGDVRMRKKRKGSVIALVVIGVLLIVSCGCFLVLKSSNEQQGRDVLTLNQLREYEAAIQSVCSGYSSKNNRVVSSGAVSASLDLLGMVSKLNETLNPSLSFVWDDLESAWVSNTESPNGGRYILTYHPTRKSETFYVLDDTGSSSLCFSVWDTASLGDLILQHDKDWNLRSINVDSQGFGVVATSEIVQLTWNGVDGNSPFRDWELKLR